MKYFIGSATFHIALLFLSLLYTEEKVTYINLVSGSGYGFEDIEEIGPVAKKEQPSPGETKPQKPEKKAEIVQKTKKEEEKKENKKDKIKEDKIKKDKKKEVKKKEDKPKSKIENIKKETKKTENSSKKQPEKTKRQTEQKGKTNKNISKTNQNSQGPKKGSPGLGKGQGIGKSDGKGSGYVDQKGIISKGVAKIQQKIMAHWSPPAAYAARSDIKVEIELRLDQDGYIISHRLINRQNNEDYNAVAESVLRTINDPRILPFPIEKNKELQHITLCFCPRDVV